MSKTAKWMSAVLFAMIIGLGTIYVDLFYRRLDVPSNASDGTVSNQRGRRTLTLAELSTILKWLGEHRYGWEMDVVTRPAPSATIVLNGSNHTAIFILNVWLDQNCGSIVAESPPSHPIGTQMLCSDQLAPLREIVGS